MHTNFHVARHADDEEKFDAAVPAFLPSLGNERNKNCDIGRQEESQKILRGGKGSALLPTLTISNQQERGPPNLSYRLRARCRAVGNNKRQV